MWLLQRIHLRFNPIRREAMEPSDEELLGATKESNATMYYSSIVPRFRVLPTTSSVESSSSESSICHTAVQESTRRVFPTGAMGMLKVNPDNIKLGKSIGKGAQGEVFDAHLDVAPKGIPGQKKELMTCAVKIFKGDYNDNLFGQWPEEVFALDLLDNNGYICHFESYCENFHGRFCLLMSKYDGSLREAINAATEKYYGVNYEAGQIYTARGFWPFVVHLWKSIKATVVSMPMNGRPFRSVTALFLIIQVAIGLATLHKHNILHRDLKADNIFVYQDEDGPWLACLGDFDNGENVLGTLFWRAPEILRVLEKIEEEIRIYSVRQSEVPYTRESDVYSFGMVCYEILTGRIPLRDHKDIYLKAGDYKAVYEAGMRPKLPEALNPVMKDLIERCWHQDPLKRPSAQGIVKELYAMVEGTPVFRQMFEKVSHQLDLGIPLGSSNYELLDQQVSELKCNMGATITELAEAVKNRRFEDPSEANDRWFTEVKEQANVFLEKFEEILEKVFADLRVKYPVEGFTRRGDEDFVVLGVELLELMKQFRQQFGWGSYLRHPRLPWSQWLARETLFEKLAWADLKLSFAFPFIYEKLIVDKLRSILLRQIRDGKDESNEGIPEEGINKEQMGEEMAAWIDELRKRTPMQDRHYGCVRRYNHGETQYAICELCQEKVKYPQQKVCTFGLFKDERKFLFLKTTCFSLRQFIRGLKTIWSSGSSSGASSGSRKDE